MRYGLSANLAIYAHEIVVANRRSSWNWVRGNRRAVPRLADLPSPMTLFPLQRERRQPVDAWAATLDMACGQSVSFSFSAAWRKPAGRTPAPIATAELGALVDILSVAAERLRGRPRGFHPSATLTVTVQIAQRVRIYVSEENTLHLGRILVPSAFAAWQERLLDWRGERAEASFTLDFSPASAHERARHLRGAAGLRRISGGAAGTPA